MSTNGKSSLSPPSPHLAQISLNNVVKGRWCQYCSGRKICNSLNCKFCFKKSFAGCDKLTPNSIKKVDCWNKIKNNAIVINNVPENVYITGFEDELSQVWTNIINNALQASKNKCTISINYNFANNHHYISLSNNGPKISEEIIDKIFDEFFTTKKRGEGTGLGLNIVRSIVEKHQGKITCISNELLTTFEITLLLI